MARSTNIEVGVVSDLFDAIAREPVSRIVVVGCMWEARELSGSCLSRWRGKYFFIILAGREL